MKGGCIRRLRSRTFCYYVQEMLLPFLHANNIAHRDLNLRTFPTTTLSVTTKARPQHRELHALLFSISEWVLLRPLLTITLKIQGTGPTVYSSYRRRPERLTIYRYNYEAARSPQLF